jgi:hypothetical protein
MQTVEQLGRTTVAGLTALVAGPDSPAEEAEARLRRNSYLALKNLSCDYNEGTLTLRGCLPTFYLQQVALAAVAGIGGVERIVSEIEVLTSARCQRGQAAGK